MRSLRRSNLALLAALAIACGESGKTAKDNAAASSTARPVVIDTTFPTVMGYAVKYAPGTWCLVTSRRDMWNGKPVILAVLNEGHQHAAYVRDSLGSCVPADSTPDAMMFALEMQYGPADTGTIGIVLRNDVMGGVRKSKKWYEGNLDGVEGREFAQECVGESHLNLFVTADSANGRLRWRHRVPLRDEFREGRAHCDGRLGEPRAPASTAAVETTAKPEGYIVFPDTRTVDPSVRLYGWMVVRRRGDQMEVVEAAAKHTATGPACQGSGAATGLGVDPQVSGDWDVLISRIPSLSISESTSPAPRIVGSGARRLAGDSVVILHRGRPLVIRSERVGEAGFRLFVDVMGARSTLYTTDFLPAGSWQVRLALDYDQDGFADPMTTITTSSGKHTIFHVSTQRPLMGGDWPAAAAIVEPAC